MLHIIFTILKIAGILLLSLIGLILFLIIFVLASPITYDIKGKWNKQLALQGKVSCLYHIIGIFIKVKDTKTSVRISIFGRVLGKNKKKSLQSKPVSQTAVSTPKDPSENKKQDSQDISESLEINEENLPEKSDPEEMCESEPENLNEKGSAESEGEEVEAETAELEVKEGEAQTTESEDEEGEAETAKTEVKEGEAQTTESEAEEENAETTESEVEKNEEGDILKSNEKKPQKEDVSELSESETDDEKIKGKEWIQRILDFVNHPSVRKLFQKLWKSIRSIIKHLWPTYMDVWARIGMEDPASTGKIMEVAALLYAFSGGAIQIISSFDEEVMEARFSVKGRIIPGYLLVKVAAMGIRILLHKECRRLYKDIKQNLL